MFSPLLAFAEILIWGKDYEINLIKLVLNLRKLVLSQHARVLDLKGPTHVELRCCFDKPTAVSSLIGCCSSHCTCLKFCWPTEPV